ncbi:hypothetical protein EJB05_52410, partial [Eragrostis curvula]
MPSSSTPCLRDMEPPRDWAPLPRDILFAVFLRLGLFDIMQGAELVCKTWRRAAVDEPALWRRVDMASTRSAVVVERSVARAAEARPFWLSEDGNFGRQRAGRTRCCGAAFLRQPHASTARISSTSRLTSTSWRRLLSGAVLVSGAVLAFWGEYAGDDRFIRYLSERAPALKSLRLIYCYDVCQEAFMEAIRKFPMLEELELSLSPNVNGAAFGVVGESCPHLKRFRLNKKIFIGLEGGGFDKDDEARGIAKMHELRSLQLFNCEFTDTGLTAILDGCPHLESLDIHRCFNVTMDATAIRAKCAMMKTLKLPHDSTASYEFQVFPQRCNIGLDG